MSPRKSELIELAGLVFKRAEDYVQVDFGLGEPVWLALAHVEISTFVSGGSSSVSMPEWLAREEGLM